MTQLSDIYENNYIYLISYFGGINGREVINETFSSESKAKQYLNNHIDEYLDPIILKIDTSNALLNVNELDEGVPFWMQSIIFSLKTYCKKEQIDCELSLKDRNVFLITNGKYKYEVIIKKSE